jgi:hypothetical protein
VCHTQCTQACTVAAAQSILLLPSMLPVALLAMPVLLVLVTGARRSLIAWRLAQQKS